MTLHIATRRGFMHATTALVAALLGAAPLASHAQAWPSKPIRWVVAYPAGGFAQLARSSPLTELAEQQLRLLNGVYGGHADPRPGQLVKVVE